MTTPTRPDIREHWNRRHQSQGGIQAEPSAWVTELADRLPSSGAALDLAGGRGRHALWMARRGLDVYLVDISDVALDCVQDAARRQALSIHTQRLDLELPRQGHDVPGPIEALRVPAGGFELVLCVDYLNRTLLPRVHQLLSPTGVALVVHPTVRNLERFDRPSRRFLLEEGELPGLLSCIEPVLYDECFRSDGRHLARLWGGRGPAGRGARSAAAAGSSVPSTAQK